MRPPGRGQAIEKGDTAVPCLQGIIPKKESPVMDAG